VLDAAMPAIEIKAVRKYIIYDLQVVIKGAIRYGNTPKQINYGITNGRLYKAKLLYFAA
jgi:hypothetical protein